MSIRRPPQKNMLRPFQDSGATRQPNRTTSRRLSESDRRLFWLDLVCCIFVAQEPCSSLRPCSASSWPSPWQRPSCIVPTTFSARSVRQAKWRRGLGKEARAKRSASTIRIRGHVPLPLQSSSPGLVSTIFGARSAFRICIRRHVPLPLQSSSPGLVPATFGVRSARQAKWRRGLWEGGPD